jgi:CrcB protein
MLWGLTEKYSWNPTYKLLLITGFCGGFTTFSAFTQEGIGLLGTQKVLPFFIYTALSVAGGFLFTYLAYKIFS